MNPKQLNGNAEFGSCPRQQHRFYSVFFGAACLQTGSADRSVTKILKLYEKDTDHARLQTPPLQSLQNQVASPRKWRTGRTPMVFRM